MIFELGLKQNQKHSAASFYCNADRLTDCLAERTARTRELKPLFQFSLLRYFPGHTWPPPEAGK